MKHVLSLILILSSFFSYSQVAVATTPDASVCVGECALFSSATSVPGSSPIINSIWSVTNNGTTYNSPVTAPGTNFPVCGLTSGTCSGSLINQHQNGTSSFTQFTDLVIIVANPTANITAAVTSCNVPMGVQYGVGTSTPASTFAWTFESGTPATFSGATPPIITYTTPNSYDVTLLVTETATGCTATATTVMQVSDFETDFTTPLTACEDVAVQLTDNSTVGANDFTWTITPGIAVTGTATPSSSTSANPSVVFSDPGTYIITLLSKNLNAPCIGTTITKQITILPAPVPSFTANPIAGCSPLPVQFTNTSAPSAGATFSWNFGHPASGAANTSSANSPSHVYTGNNSSFTPSLTMTGSNGCFTTFSTPIITLAPLEAHFTTDRRDGCEGTVAFNDISIIPAGTSVISRSWNFGDGGTDNTASPSHSYVCGEYNVRLIVTVTGGCSDTVFLNDANAGTQIFDFAGTGYSTLTGTALVGDTVLRFGTLPVANYTLDHNNDCIKQPFELLDVTPINCPHGLGDVKRKWFLNDVQSSIDSLFIKIFTDTMQNIGPNLRPGTDIALEVDFRGCKDSIQTHDSIYISAPISRFALSPITCNFGINPPIAPGSKVTVVNDSQSIYGHKWLNNTAPLNPQIIDSTVANLAFDKTEVTFRWGDGTADFYATNAQGTLDPFIEDVGNYATDVDPANPTLNGLTTANPLSHEYTQYGTYQVTQVIQNFNSLGTPTGCIDSSTQTVHVSWISTDFVFDEVGLDNDEDSVCINNPFGMIQTSSTHNNLVGNTGSNHGPLNYTFSSTNFPVNPATGNNLITGTDPQTLYNTAIGVAGPNQLITLTTTNAVGCSLTATGTINVLALPSASFTLSDFVGCNFVPFASDATNTSTHPPLSFEAGNNTVGWAPNGFQWSLNGVNISTTNNRSDVFPNTVTANATYGLVVTDAFGCVSPLAQQTASVQQPTAGILNPSNVCSSDVSGQSIQFGGNGNIVTYEWRLDGVVVPLNSPTIPFPTGPSPLPDWTIPVGGPTSVAHTIGLIVTDNEGCSDSLGITGVPNVVNIISPQADFSTVLSSASVAVGGVYNCPPVIANFTDLSQSFSPITNYAWICETILTNPTITTSTLASPQGIQYLFPGTYDVTLLIQDANGCTASIKKLQVVQISGPSAKDSIEFLQTTCGQSFDFKVMNQVNVASWYWEMGDGNTVTNLDFPADEFTYVYGGTNTTYNPTLHVVDALGCDVPYDSLIVVPDNGVTAFFVADPITDINLGTNITFDPTGSSSLGSNLVEWQWNYGDGSLDSTFTSTNVDHFYSIGDTVMVTLTVEDATGCKDDYTFPLLIGVDFDFPNVLTGDGSNSPNADYQLFADVMKSFEITIVNRWGNVVHEGKLDPARPRYLWNGVDDKSGKLCKEGTYFYLFKGILKNDVPVDIHGFCTLIGTTDK